MPLRILWELLDALEDIFTLVRIHSKFDALSAVRATAVTVRMLEKMGSFDLVDVDAGHGSERVKIKVCLR